MTFPTPHLQFIDSKGKVHATAAAAGAAELASVLGSEVFARTVLANRAAVMAMIHHVEVLEEDHARWLSQQPHQPEVLKIIKSEACNPAASPAHGE